MILAKREKYTNRQCVHVRRTLRLVLI